MLKEEKELLLAIGRILRARIGDQGSSYDTEDKAALTAALAPFDGTPIQFEMPNGEKVGYA